jgi:hypothetical protein
MGRMRVFFFDARHLKKKTLAQPLPRKRERG